MQERDFKGVWIPKKIWLNKDLTMLEKVILIEIDSLDNEEHCTASNKYLAEFCQCSERKVSEAITKLINLGLIEIVSFDGRCRVLKSNLNNKSLATIQTSKICEADQQNPLSINIDNNIDNTNVLSDTDNTNVLSGETANTEEFLISPETHSPKKSLTSKTTPKKRNLYSSCIEVINNFTEEEDVRECLRDFLNMRIANTQKPFGVKSFEGMLKKLRTLTTSKKEVIKIITQATDRCYLTFYPITGYSYSKPSNPEIISKGEKRSITDEEFEEAIKLGQKF